MQVKKIYSQKKSQIDQRLKEFRCIWREQDDRKIFAELVFCLLTPQSKAKICWSVVEDLLCENLLFKGNKRQICEKINNVRFKNNKAGYICLARECVKENGEFKISDRLRQFNSSSEAREWLVKNVKGLGYKEASHFLRNIGLGGGLAILDRHILKNLKRYKVIKEVPKSLSRKKYLEIEQKMVKFASRIKVPMECLDLVLWCKETGEVFK